MNKYISLLIGFIFLISCGKEKIIKRKIVTPKQDHQVLFVTNPKDSMSLVIEDNMRHLCDYTKFSFKTIENVDLDYLDKINDNTSLLVLTGSDTLHQKTIKKIVEYVKKGGTLCIPNATKDQRLSYLLGLKLDADFGLDFTSSGFSFNEVLIPGYPKKTYKPTYVHGGLGSHNFNEDVNVYASAVNNPLYPVIIENYVGLGKTIYVNSYYQYEKDDRGLLFMPVLKAMEGIPYPIANVSTIFLDDFPSPVYPSKPEPIKTEFNLSNAEFVRQIWWPDMAKYADSLDIKYTALSIYDYSLNTVPPFSYSEWEQVQDSTYVGKKSIVSTISKSVVKDGHELGLHGYNHVSLLNEEWNKRPDYMAMALQSVSKKWKTENFGKLPVSYVPPTNYIDSIGIQALRKGMPSVKYMCSLYLGEKHDGGGREFDVDPYNKNLFDYPRISDGYEPNDKIKFSYYSLFLYTGIWTHFIHPDDIYQIPNENNLESRGEFEFRNKNSLGWRSTPSRPDKKGLLTLFIEDVVTPIKKTYPLQRYKTVKDAVPIVKNWKTTYPEYKITEDELTLVSNKNTKDSYWSVFIGKNFAREYEKSLIVNDVIYTKTKYLDGYLYSFLMKEKSIVLMNVNHLKSQLVQLKTRDLEYELFELLNGKIKNLIKQNRLREATNALEAYISERPTIKDNVFRIYAKYMSWQNRNDATWKFLYDYSNRYKTKDNFDYSKTLKQYLALPSTDVYNLWLYKYMLLEPKNTAHYKEFIANNYEPRFYSEIKRMYKIIQKLEPSHQNRANYLMFLVSYYPDDFAKELNMDEVCSNPLLKEESSNFAWFFSERKQYKKAIACSGCNNGIIDDDTKYSWYTALGDTTAVKTLYYDRYFKDLLYNNPEQALKEVATKDVCKDELYVKHSDEITWLYAGKENYKKALSWSTCSDSIKLLDKFDWMYKMQDKQAIKTAYQEHLALQNHAQTNLLAEIVALRKNSFSNADTNNALKQAEQAYLNFEEHHTEDNAKLANYVADIYLEDNLFKEAWQVVNTMPEGTLKAEKQALLNEQVLAQKTSIQTYLLANQEELFYPKVLESVKASIVFREHNYAEWESVISLDKTSVNAIVNNLSGVVVAKNEHKHRVTLHNPNIYKVKNLNRLNRFRRENIQHTYFGLKYAYINDKVVDNWNYQLGAGMDVSVKGNKNLYNLMGGVSYKAETMFSNLQFTHDVPLTSVAYTLGIYDTKLSWYSEYFHHKKNEFRLTVEGDLYSDGNNQIATVVRYYRLFSLSKKSTLSPFAETAYSASNANLPGGLPYFALKSRAYYGGGLRYQYLVPENDYFNRFSGMIEPSYFTDTYYNTFGRFYGELTYKFRDYTFFYFSGEYFSQDNFYSNTFNVGFKHIF
ncbi:DUF2194 domain-containing protein [Wenyingzhuangia aestuarii]|uniref:DUF2194 domain-containing protein n=1 Tax=Wenyingzhuangia aestuarii TaxID=1647582 RepID=UPI00143ADDCB|nr:DUF2194 domain-containing protein [Wenyingzhuangia aestuarii]NJB81772.1 hypothetical protein [Wenyingzhuangia aestuarii]